MNKLLEKRYKRIIIVLLIMLGLGAILLYFSINNNVKKSEKEYNRFLTVVHEEVDFLMDDTERVLSKETEEEILDVFLLKIERGLGRIELSLRLANRTINENIEEQINFTQLAKLRTPDLQTDEETQLFVGALHEALLYIFVEMEKHRSEDENEFKLSVAKFNEIIRESTGIYTRNLE